MESKKIKVLGVYLSKEAHEALGVPHVSEFSTIESWHYERKIALRALDWLTNMGKCKRIERFEEGTVYEWQRDFIYEFIAPNGCVSYFRYGNEARFIIMQQYAEWFEDMQRKQNIVQTFQIIALILMQTVKSLTDLQAFYITYSSLYQS